MQLHAPMRLKLARDTCDTWRDRTNILLSQSSSFWRARARSRRETRMDGQRSSARSTAGMRMMRGSGDLSDFKPLGRVLAHELLRLQQGSAPTNGARRACRLAAANVTTYIEEHLAEPILLATLAELAGLSTYHFCRAFKQSFGLPPHRSTRAASSTPSAAGEARPVGHRYRHDGRLQRDELIHSRLSQGDRAYPQRLSPEPGLAGAPEPGLAGSGAAASEQGGLRFVPSASAKGRATTR